MSGNKQSGFMMDDFFWSDIRREFTENLLKQDGTFLLRKASQGDEYVLSVFWEGKVRHYQPVHDGKSFSFGDKKFAQVEQLLYYHFTKRVALRGEVASLLKKPILKKKTTYRMSDIEIKDKLGEGIFREVHKVTIKSENKEAAMKTLKENVPKAIRETFVKELGLMQTMDHVNVVKCLGVVDENDNQMRILSECINKGSLDKLILESRLTPRGKARIILDAGRGMKYLHKLNIIHRDLAARNILVHKNDDGTIVGKVSDFGLSRQDEGGRGYELKSAQKLPLKWLAPECFKHKLWTTASDVWSFGVLMWEVFTNGADPYSDFPEAQGEENVCKFISDGGHPRRPPDCRDDMWQLMLNIFNSDDKRRVSMEGVVKELTRIYTVIKHEEDTSSRPKSMIEMRRSFICHLY